VADVANDGQKPRPRLTAIEGSKVLERSQRPLLHGIFSVLIAARQPPRESITGVEMLQHTAFERFGFRLVYTHSWLSCSSEGSVWAAAASHHRQRPHATRTAPVRAKADVTSATRQRRRRAGGGRAVVEARCSLSSGRESRAVARPSA